MARKVRWHQTFYKVKNTDKYAGAIVEGKQPFARSSWELTFMRFCDHNENIISWASEPVKIPYVHPLKGRGAVYVPDFIICYRDKHGMKHVEMIEIKPYGQAVLTENSSSKEKSDIIVNTAKWQAAVKFCKHNDMTFRILTKEDIYVT